MAGFADKGHRIACNPFSWAHGYVQALKTRKRAEIMAYVGWALFCIALVVMFSGCATCTKVCITDCPSELEIIESAPEVIIVPAPLPRIPEIPPMQSVEQKELVLIDPLGWAEFAIGDLMTARRMLYAIAEEIQAIDASRPIAPDP